MDINWLEKQHTLYKQQERDYGSTQLKVSSNPLFGIPSQTYYDIRDAMGDISEEAKDQAIERMIYRSKTIHSHFARKFLDAVDRTGYGYMLDTGIGRDMLDQTKRGIRFLPKHQFFALCLVCSFSWDDVVRACDYLEIPITLDYMDVIFEAFVKAGRYDMDDWVQAVRTTADALIASGKDVKLEPFFKQNYFNDNIELPEGFLDEVLVLD